MSRNQDEETPRRRDSYSPSTPDIFCPTFQGTPRRYHPSEFGLAEDEPFYHPRVLRDLRFDTSIPELEPDLQVRDPRGLQRAEARPSYADQHAPDTVARFRTVRSRWASNAPIEPLDEAAREEAVEKFREAQRAINTASADEVECVTDPTTRFRELREAMLAREAEREAAERAASELVSVDAISRFNMIRASQADRATAAASLSQIATPDVSDAEVRPVTPIEIYEIEDSGGEPAEWSPSHYSQELTDISEPFIESYETTPSPDAYLTEVSAPSFASVELTPRQGPPLPTELLSDVSDPSLASPVRSPSFTRDLRLRTPQLSPSSFRGLPQNMPRPSDRAMSLPEAIVDRYSAARRNLSYDDRFNVQLRPSQQFGQRQVCPAPAVPEPQAEATPSRMDPRIVARFRQLQDQIETGVVQTPIRTTTPVAVAPQVCVPPRRKRLPRIRPPGQITAPAVAMVATQPCPGPSHSRIPPPGSRLVSRIPPPGSRPASRLPPPGSRIMRPASRPASRIPPPRATFRSRIPPPTMIPRSQISASSIYENITPLQSRRIRAQDMRRRLNFSLPESPSLSDAEQVVDAAQQVPCAAEQVAGDTEQIASAVEQVATAVGGEPTASGAAILEYSDSAGEINEYPSWFLTPPSVDEMQAEPCDGEAQDEQSGRFLNLPEIIITADTPTRLGAQEHFSPPTITSTPAPPAHLYPDIEQLHEERSIIERKAAEQFALLQTAEIEPEVSTPCEPQQILSPLQEQLQTPPQRAPPLRRRRRLQIPSVIIEESEPEDVSGATAVAPGYFECSVSPAAKSTEYPSWLSVPSFEGESQVAYPTVAGPTLEERIAQLQATLLPDPPEIIITADTPTRRLQMLQQDECDIIADVSEPMLADISAPSIDAASIAQESYYQAAPCEQLEGDLTPSRHIQALLDREQIADISAPDLTSTSIPSPIQAFVSPVHSPAQAAGHISPCPSTPFAAELLEAQEPIFSPVQRNRVMDPRLVARFRQLQEQIATGVVQTPVQTTTPVRVAPEACVAPPRGRVRSRIPPPGHGIAPTAVVGTAATQPCPRPPSRMPPPGSRIPPPSRLPPPGSRPASRLQPPGSRIVRPSAARPASRLAPPRAIPGSRLPPPTAIPRSRLPPPTTIPGSRLPAPSVRAIRPRPRYIPDVCDDIQTQEGVNQFIDNARRRLDFSPPSSPVRRVSPARRTAPVDTQAVSAAAVGPAEGQECYSPVGGNIEYPDWLTTPPLDAEAQAAQVASAAHQTMERRMAQLQAQLFAVTPPQIIITADTPTRQLQLMQQAASICPAGDPRPHTHALTPPQITITADTPTRQLEMLHQGECDFIADVSAPMLAEISAISVDEASTYSRHATCEQLEDDTMPEWNLPTSPGGDQLENISLPQFVSTPTSPPISPVSTVHRSLSSPDLPDECLESEMQASPDISLPCITTPVVELESQVSPSDQPEYQEVIPAPATATRARVMDPRLVARFRQLQEQIATGIVQTPVRTTTPVPVAPEECVAPLRARARSRIQPPGQRIDSPVVMDAVPPCPTPAPRMPSPDVRPGSRQVSRQQPPGARNVRPSAARPTSRRAPPRAMPGPRQPGTQQPGPRQPGSRQTGPRQTGPRQPISRQPASRQPASRQPVSRQPGSRQAGSRQPGSRQPGPRQPGPRQPGLRQPESQQPGSRQTGPTAIPRSRLPAPGARGARPMATALPAAVRRPRYIPDLCENIDPQAEINELIENVRKRLSFSPQASPVRPASPASRISPGGGQAVNAAVGEPATSQECGSPMAQSMEYPSWLATPPLDGEVQAVSTAHQTIERRIAQLQAQLFAPTPPQIIITADTPTRQLQMMQQAPESICPASDPRSHTHALTPPQITITADTPTRQLEMLHQGECDFIADVSAPMLAEISAISVDEASTYSPHATCEQLEDDTMPEWNLPTSPGGDQLENISLPQFVSTPTSPPISPVSTVHRSLSSPDLPDECLESEMQASPDISLPCITTPVVELESQVSPSDQPEYQEVIPAPATATRARVMDPRLVARFRQLQEQIATGIVQTPVRTTTPVPVAPEECVAPLRARARSRIQPPGQRIDSPVVMDAVPPCPTPAPRMPSPDVRPGSRQVSRQQPPGARNVRPSAARPTSRRAPPRAMPGPRQPGTQQPGPRQPGSRQTGPRQPISRQPASRQLPSRQPVSRQPVSRQPGSRQPGPRQPGQRQPGQRQPGPRQPRSQQPSSRQPGPTAIPRSRLPAPGTRARPAASATGLPAAVRRPRYIPDLCENIDPQAEIGELIENVRKRLSFSAQASPASRTSPGGGQAVSAAVGEPTTSQEYESPVAQNMEYPSWLTTPPLDSEAQAAPAASAAHQTMQRRMAQLQAELFAATPPQIIITADTPTRQLQMMQQAPESICPVGDPRSHTRALTPPQITITADTPTRQLEMLHQGECDFIADVSAPMLAESSAISVDEASTYSPHATCEQLEDDTMPEWNFPTSPGGDQLENISLPQFVSTPTSPPISPVSTVHRSLSSPDLPDECLESEMQASPDVSLPCITTPVVELESQVSPSDQVESQEVRPIPTVATRARVMNPRTIARFRQLQEQIATGVIQDPPPCPRPPSRIPPPGSRIPPPSRLPPPGSIRPSAARPASRLSPPRAIPGSRLRPPTAIPWSRILAPGVRSGLGAGVRSRPRHIPDLCENIDPQVEIGELIQNVRKRLSSSQASPVRRTSPGGRQAVSAAAVQTATSTKRPPAAEYLQCSISPQAASAEYPSWLSTPPIDGESNAELAAGTGIPQIIVTADTPTRQMRPEASAPAGEIISEAIIQESINNNGDMQTSMRHVITRRDDCGNITTETRETRAEADSEQLIENFKNRLGSSTQRDTSDTLAINPAELVGDCLQDISVRPQASGWVSNICPEKEENFVICDGVPEGSSAVPTGASQRGVCVPRIVITPDSPSRRHRESMRPSQIQVTPTQHDKIMRLMRTARRRLDLDSTPPSDDERCQLPAAPQDMEQLQREQRRGIERMAAQQLALLQGARVPQVSPEVSPECPPPQPSRQPRPSWLPVPAYVRLRPRLPEPHAPLRRSQRPPPPPSSGGLPPYLRSRPIPAPSQLQPRPRRPQPDWLSLSCVPEETSSVLNDIADISEPSLVDVSTGRAPFPVDLWQMTENLADVSADLFEEPDNWMQAAFEDMPNYIPFEEQIGSPNDNCPQE